MTRLITKMILFLAILATFLGGNYLVNRWLIGNRGGALDGVVTLIVGDSHLLTGVNPELLPGSENICQNGEPYIVTFHKLRYLLARNPDIETVVLGFSYHNLSAFNDYKFVDASTAKAQFDRVYLLMSPDDFAPLPFDRRKYYRSIVRHTMLYPTLDHSKQFTGAFEAAEFGLEQSDVATTISRHYYRDGANVGVSLVATSYLDSIATVVVRPGRRLVLLSPPLRPEYIERIPENFVTHFRRTRVRFETMGVPVLNLSDQEWEAGLFKDYDHLDAEGAAKLTKILADWLKGKRGG